MVDAEHESGCWRVEVEVLVLDLVWLAEAPLLIFLLLPPLHFSLAHVGDELARRSREARVVAFTLA